MFLLFTTINVIGGCAAIPPVLIQAGYAKTAADVVSYATTEKGTTDHVISVMIEKDCALHRVLSKDGVVCFDTNNDDVVTAKNKAAEKIEKSTNIKNLLIRKIKQTAKTQ